jgi:hypothetical protein
MPNLSSKATEIQDLGEMLDRIIYRNARLLDRLADKDDPTEYVRLMAGRNRTDLRRLAELLDHDISGLSSQ